MPRPEDDPTDEKTTVDGEEGPEVITSIDELIKCDPVIRMFGDSAKTRVLMALDNWRHEPLRPTDICEHARLSRSSWYNVRDDLLDIGLIEQVDKAGNAPRYTMPREDARVIWFQWLVDFAKYSMVTPADDPTPNVEVETEC